MKLRDRLPDQREVQVWFVDLAASMASVEACFHSLSAAERDRASQFCSEKLKNAFTLSRGILRALLGAYLGSEAGCLRFAYGLRGKPRLAFPETPLTFNLAHSGKFAAYAFAVGCEVGVDIEEIRPMRDQEEVVRRFFAREECEEWLTLDPAQRDAGFYRGWTRKEAFIKALGDGLSVPLDSFRVSLRPEAPAKLLHVDKDPAAAGRWSLFSLIPADGYIGALAMAERNRVVSILPRMTAAEVLKIASGPGPFPPLAKEVVAAPA
jgi:4'-phosphopantetheinyl transferase